MLASDEARSSPAPPHWASGPAWAGGTEGSSRGTGVPGRALLKFLLRMRIFSEACGREWRLQLTNELEPPGPLSSAGHENAANWPGKSGSDRGCHSPQCVYGPPLRSHTREPDPSGGADIKVGLLFDVQRPLRTASRQADLPGCCHALVPVCDLRFLGCPQVPWARILEGGCMTRDSRSREGYVGLAMGSQPAF